MEKISQDKLIERYTIARYSIQLVNVTLIKVETFQTGEASSKDLVFEVEVAFRVEIINKNKSHGFLQVSVEGLERDSRESICNFTVEYRGEFVNFSEETDVKVLEKYTHVQVVPQLLPYVRASISNLSGMMNMSPVLLPTMDVIESLRQNNQLSDDGE